MTIKSRDLAPAATSANTASGANVSRWMRQGEDSGGYDPEKFYTKAHDYRGHGERVSVTLPPDVYAQVQQMVHEDQMVDYTMPADFVRDAIVHHLQMRKSQLGSPRLREAVEELIRSLTLAEMIKRDLEEAGRWHVMDEEIDGVMGIFERDRAFDQMAVRLGLYEEFMEHAAEPYRSKALAKVRQWTEKIPPEFAAD